MLRIAVIGGGTAGYLAAAHLTKHFRDLVNLYHIYDPSIPTIGVGEGTTPSLRYWLKNTLGVTEAEVIARCDATRKYGILFENWGRQNAKFMHHFFPVRDLYAYHISARKLVELLSEHVVATRIHKRVECITQDEMSAEITFDDGGRLGVDYIIDARGFPKDTDASRIEIPWIPTNSALIRRGPVINGGTLQHEINGMPFEYTSATRSVARPHGWIFVIPLTSRTSYGYIFNNQFSSPEEIRADFEVFLDANCADCAPAENHLQFPNFTRRTFFDGVVMNIGNSASFLEPLEATAIAIALSQINAFSRWPLGRLANSDKTVLWRRNRHNAEDLKTFNTYLLKTIMRISVFVGWHYSMGSRFKSEFWRYAQGRARSVPEILPASSVDLKTQWKKVTDAVSHLPHPFEDQIDFQHVCEPGPRPNRPIYGMFTPESFAEVGHGIGAL